ncbi:MAG: hypothetical protein J1E63_01745 [Muribaculaceae bacterium]|nr:hypothetical protein [Muribaculaceae bacterium]
MKAIERAAVTRVLIDLIKADKVIDSREMDLYRELKNRFAITRDDEKEAFGMTLSKAIAVIKAMKPDEVVELMGIFEDMTVSDSFCAREEALLMLMLHFCLSVDSLDCDVISTVIQESWFDERQVLYVESHHAKDINFAISTNLRAISRELKLCGLDFVYLPQVVHHYITTPRQLLNEVVTMLSPTLSEDSIAGLLTKIKLLKTDTFCVEQLHHKLGFKELADTAPALMLRIGQSRVQDRIYTNFLRVELTPEVLEIVQQMVDTFLEYNGSDRIIISHKKDEKGSFLYNGFYRQIFEILLLQKAVSCHLLIDFIHGTISFPEVDVVLSTLHRKEKALYTLFVFEAIHNAIKNEDGTIIQNGGINFKPPTIARQLDAHNRRMAALQKKYKRIYEAFGGDSNSAPDITNPEIRRPMISGIKRAIKKYSEKIYDSERFMINRDSNGIYSISANPSAFQIKSYKQPKGVDAGESQLFAELAKIK